jgi:hypothetical protein
LRSMDLIRSFSAESATRVSIIHAQSSIHVSVF